MLCLVAEFTRSLRFVLLIVNFVFVGGVCFCALLCFCLLR